jgi:hypothetical protein
MAQNLVFYGAMEGPLKRYPQWRLLHTSTNKIGESGNLCLKLLNLVLLYHTSD